MKCRKFVLFSALKIRKSRVEIINDVLRSDPLNEKYTLERNMVDEICHLEGEAAVATHDGAGDETAVLDTIALSGDDLHYYLHDLSHHCDEMFLRCFFEGHERNCSEIFISTVTDEGECCAFNLMPEAVMFKNDEVGVRTTGRFGVANYSE